jgi:hypothetical protein
MFENKRGSIVRFIDDNSGIVSDSEMQGTEYHFAHQGARPTFVEGENVTYLLINNNGNKKVVNLGRPN